MNKNSETEGLLQKYKTLNTEVENLNGALYEKEEHVKKLMRENDQLKYAVKINKV